MRGREILFDNLSEKEKGYLFGLFEGDGYKIYNKKSRHYQVEFYFNSEKDVEIIEKVVVLLKKIRTAPSLYKDKRFKCMRIRVYSKNLFEVMGKNISFRNKTNDFKLGFVSGIIDSEGYVNVSKFMIMVVSTNRSVLELCKNFLFSVGVSCSISLRKISVKNKLKSYKMYISVSFKRLNHLSIKAGKLK